MHTTIIGIYSLYTDDITRCWDFMPERIKESNWPSNVGYTIKSTGVKFMYILQSAIMKLIYGQCTKVFCTQREIKDEKNVQKSVHGIFMGHIIRCVINRWDST